MSLTLGRIEVPALLLDVSGCVLWQNDASRRQLQILDNRAFLDSVGSSADRSAVSALVDTIRLREIGSRGESPVELELSGLSASGAPAHGRWLVVPIESAVALAAALCLEWRGDRHQAPVSLTTRQREILDLLAVGESTRSIAARLCLSTTTVRNHVAGLLAALGCHTRLEGVARARAIGLID